MELHESLVLTGDLVQIINGMEIPADGIVINCQELQMDEAAMTGI